MNKNIELYHKYFVCNAREQLHLFQILQQKYAIRSALYPGSFIHITPAFVYPETAFIDNDRRVAKFFGDQMVLEMVSNNQEYSATASIKAFQQDYQQPAPLPAKHFDLLISQYAGFVSQATKQYLKIGGILLVNNSHADAGMAYLDADYQLIGVANHTKNKWRVVEDNLSAYFIPKRGQHSSEKELKEQLIATMTGIGYTKTAPNYLFKRVA